MSRGAGAMDDQEFEGFKGFIKDFVSECYGDEGYIMPFLEMVVHVNPRTSQACEPMSMRNMLDYEDDQEKAAAVRAMRIMAQNLKATELAFASEMRLKLKADEQPPAPPATGSTDAGAPNSVVGDLEDDKDAFDAAVITFEQLGKPTSACYARIIRTGPPPVPAELKPWQDLGSTLSGSFSRFLPEPTPSTGHEEGAP